MSEDPGINLEDDGPAIPAADPPADPPVADPPPADDDGAAEVEAVEVGGKKYVPIAAVINERRLRQQSQTRAQRADELEAYVNDARPYVEFLRANPNLLTPRQPDPAPAAPAAPDADPEAVEVCRLLDLYTPDGQPDLKRAAQFLVISDRRSDRRVQQAVAPVHQTRFEEQSARNFHLASQYKDPSGRPVNIKALEQIWRTVPAEQSADPNVASILMATAIGLGYASGKPQPLAPPPPLVTEGGGGGARPKPLSAIEQRVAKDRGVSEATWADATKTFQPGRANQLED